MPSFNFKPQFADDVENYIKLQTIRSTRRGKVGDTAYLYTGMRTKKCRKLGEGILTEIRSVYIVDNYVYVQSGDEYFTTEKLDEFARTDGFRNWVEMKAWFSNQYGLPYSGCMHKWKPKEKEIKNG